MATVSYPKVPARAWSLLRSRAVTAPSTKFTPTSVAAMLGMSSPKSAGDNIVYPMRRVGLFDEDGALTARGNKWRVDSTYGDACQEILDEIYPAELAGFTNADGEPDVSQVLTWMQHKGLGNSNARQMAATYTMIADKKIPTIPTSQPKKTKQARPSKASREPVEADEVVDVVTQPAPALPPPRQSSNGPNIHLDIQIHIPVEASADQIEQIFASMAKHLYRT